MSQAIIAVENLSKRYLIAQSPGQNRYIALRDVICNKASTLGRVGVDLIHGRRLARLKDVNEFWALRDVSFEIKEGEVVGIIGRNGAGKSTLLKLLSRITEPTRGRITLRGRIASLLEVGTGFHPELTGRENIFLNGAVLGMRKAEIKRKFDDIVGFAEVERFLDTPVKRYSSGMYVRLAFAVAAFLEPEILVVDEVLAVGDIEFQKKCLGKMNDVARGGRTVLFVSHNMAAVTSLTTRGIVLRSGEVAFNGATADAVAYYVQLGTAGMSRTEVLGRGIQATIIDASLVNSLGEPTRTYTPGSPMRLEVTFETDGAPRLSLEALLLDSGRYKLGLASLHHFHGLSLPARPGRYKVVFELGPLWLASGTYSFDIATSIVNSCWDHYVEGLVEFDVNYSNPGGQSWDFKSNYGFGAIALTAQSPTFQSL